MNFDTLDLFKSVEKQYGRLALVTILNMTEDDIKVNRIAFGKRTSSKEYMKIFKRSFKIWQRHLRYS